MCEDKRVCGACTACCKTHPIVEIDKPAGSWCSQCDVGHGCRIYAERPTSCREFQCQWLKGSWEENDRPDKTKVVIDFSIYPSIGRTMMLFEVAIGGLDRRFASLVRKAAIKARYAIQLVPVSGEAVLILEKGRTVSDDFVLEGGRKVRVEYR